MKNGIIFLLYFVGVWGCGARTELPAPRLVATPPNPANFAGLWNGTGANLPRNHPYCAGRPNVWGDGVAAPNNCTFQVAVDEQSGELLGVIGANLGTFQMGLLGDWGIYHRLRVESATHAVFLDAVNVDDAGIGFERISGTADLEGDTLVLRICYTIRSSRDPPIELAPSWARECRLRRVR